MGSALASLLGLVFTGIALYGFYWVIRLAVRDGILDASTRQAETRADTPAVAPDVPAPTQPAA